MRIIYFDLDAVRQDHLGVYGYGRETSPNIDALAKEAAVFHQCYTTDAPCVPSRTALFSCRPGIANGVISHEWPGCLFRFPGHEGMPSYFPEYTMPMRLLQENDYHTVTFSIFAQRHLSWYFNAGFSEVLNPTRPSNHENTSEINPRVIKWIKDNIRDYDNLFLHVNYWDGHTPYHPDDDCLQRVSRHPLPKFPNEDQIKYHYENVYGPKTARDIMIRRSNCKSDNPYMPDEISDLRDFKKMLDAYDASIATADKAVCEVIETLKQEDIFDETVIVISSDHGEAIGQMGMYFEHGLAVDAVNRLPLIVRWPGLTDQGAHSDAFVYQFDMMATIIDMLGIENPPMWEAQSFARALSGEPFEGRPYLVYGEGLFTLQRAVRTKHHALVKTFHSGCYPIDSLNLYDIVSDPEQFNDIKNRNPEIVSELEALYAEWWNRYCVGPDAVADPMLEQIPHFSYFPYEEYFQRLKDVNRPDQLEDLKSRLTACRRNKHKSTAPITKL